MSDPTATHPFAPFEWMLSLRYLRARRQEGFISVNAGFSFLGIMLGVATLIIVMAVMNGFRKELLEKILGLNGHLMVHPLEAPLTDWRAGHRAGVAHSPASRLAAPIVDGKALASSGGGGAPVPSRGDKPFASSVGEGVIVRGIRGAGPRQARRDRPQRLGGHVLPVRRPRRGRRGDRQAARRETVDRCRRAT